VGIDERLIIRPVDRVVERGGVGSHLDAPHPGKRAIVHEREAAAGLDPVAEPLFLATLADVLAVRVANCDADRTALSRSLPQQIIEARVRLVQEDGGIHQHINLLASLLQHVHDGGHGDVCPLVVQRHQFRADGASGPRLAERWPKSVHVFS
jgi:hypothetical protein